MTNTENDRSTKQVPSFPFMLPEEQTPTVQSLMVIIGQLQEQIRVLEEELARVKKLPKRPKIRPSVLEKGKHKDDDASGSTSGNSDSSSSGKRPGSKKRKKKLTIHETKVLQPEDVPPGSRFLGYQDYLVQGLRISQHNIRYRRARYLTPEGIYLTGSLPEEAQGTHFDPTLKTYILYQYHHQRVTQPLILQQLTEWGFDISSGELSLIISEENNNFHDEKDILLPAGLASSGYLNVDDTGARHAGMNGYCTHVGNERFAFFKSTDSKTRINFLEILRGHHTDYVINDHALEYMKTQKLPKGPRELLSQGEKILADSSQWQNHLTALGVIQQRHIRIATEATLIGSLVYHGFPPELVIVSDDAGQFDVFSHALCWIHAERTLQRILPLTDVHAKAVEWAREQIWQFYEDLKSYKQEPSETTKYEIGKRFDEIFLAKTEFHTLNLALKRLYKNKNELLLVLKRPDIPLHNNLSERDIREYVIKRKISGSTRSDEGRRSRDTFASLKKTAKKLGISFWDYLLDRVSLKNQIPPLPQLVANAPP